MLQNRSKLVNGRTVDRKHRFRVSVNHCLPTPATANFDGFIRQNSDSHLSAVLATNLTHPK